MLHYQLPHLRQLEAESIYIIREAKAECKNPVMLYSVGKDSSVMIRLAQKAFYPGKLPFPLMHIDTGYKFPEMYEFRDRFCQEIDAELIVERNEEWISKKAHPAVLGNDRCCYYLKTMGLLKAMEKHGFDAALGGSRREEEKSRAKERIFSVRDPHGQWDPKKQRAELWQIYNTALNQKETIRIFPLSNWTELDIWEYIKLENIRVVPLYFAKKRKVIIRDNLIIPCYASSNFLAKNKANPKLKHLKTISCRFRTLGCIPCTGAISSTAKTIDEIINELKQARLSERENRIIDLTSDSAMEQKKKEGYF
jgi:sulfate adenylyltransferase subunit 2